MRDDLLDRLLALWTNPIGPDGEAAFARVYADPVVVNGAPLNGDHLVARARMLQAAFSGLGMEILDAVHAPDRIVIAFVMRGTHTGEYASPVGVVPPTGRDVSVRTIDVLTVEDGLVTAIWVVADELSLLAQLGVLDAPVPPSR